MDLFTLIAVLFAMAAVAGLAQQALAAWRDVRLKDASALREAFRDMPADQPVGDVPEFPAGLKRRDVH